jgi:hypothetical protein
MHHCETAEHREQFRLKNDEDLECIESCTGVCSPQQPQEGKTQPTGAFKILEAHRLRRYNVIIPTPGKLRQEDLEFKASLGYIARPCLKKKKKKKTIWRKAGM